MHKKGSEKIDYYLRSNYCVFEERKTNDFNN